MIQYTPLKDRLLRYDGKCIVDPDQIADLLLAGITPSKIITTEINDEVEQFNTMSDDKIELYSESDLQLDFTWLIPKEYLEIDLIEYFGKFLTPDNEARISAELEMVIKMQVENEIRTMIFVIDELRRTKQIWGVGRGSSCASYLLFLIGLHCVDPIKYNIPMEEFYH